MPPGGDALRSQHGAQRTHVFVPGLRFDTELQFQAQARGARHAWRKLPMAQVQARDSGWVALRQACALVTGRGPRMDALRKTLGADLWSLDGQPLARRITESCLGLAAGWHPGWKGADHVMQLPSAGMACLQQPEGRIWAFIAGVEWVAKAARADCAARSGSARVTGLLVLDPRRPAPWGAAYNTRLLRAAGRWRGIDGEVGEALLVGWISLDRRPVFPVVPVCPV